VREDDGTDGQDLYRQAAQGKESQRVDCRVEAALLAISSRRQRRLAGRLCATSEEECAKGSHVAACSVFGKRDRTPNNKRRLKSVARCASEEFGYGDPESAAIPRTRKRRGRDWSGRAGVCVRRNASTKGRISSGP